jgi:plasmid stability protein
MIQVRNVPDALHRKLKARAAMQGLSLSDYLLGEIRRVAEQPTLEELWERIKRRGRVELTVNPADLIREERDRR